MTKAELESGLNELGEDFEEGGLAVDPAKLETLYRLSSEMIRESERAGMGPELQIVVRG